VSGKAAAWAAVLAGGALLATLGATAASTADTGNGVGMIVFGLLAVSVGLSGLLGVLHDPDSTGLMFAFFGVLVPGYSLPFLLYYAGKGLSGRAEWRAGERRREREVADGVRCAECWRRLPGEHASSCADHVHRPAVVRRDGGEWILGGSAPLYLPPRSYYTARCSCGWETADHSSAEAAISTYDAYHASHVTSDPVQVLTT
jgi:hypothetical protein